MAEPAVKSMSRLQAAIADAIVAAWIAFALFCLTLGVRTVDSVGGLKLVARPGLLAIVVGGVFVGRLLLNLFWWNSSWKLPRPTWRPAWPIPSVGGYGKDYGGYLLVGAAFLLPIVALRHREDFSPRHPAPLSVRPVDPRPHLCDARLRAQHRGRARRASRSRLCRLLRGRRLHLRAACLAFRPRLLDLPAARGPARGVVGRGARLPRAAASRRLSRHRHARLRRDRPHRAPQLDRGDQRARTASPTFRSRPFSASPSRRPARIPSRAFSGCATTRYRPSCSSIT